MDLFVIRAITQELKAELSGGFIAKIYQMNRNDLILRVRRHAEHQLLISTHPDFFRIHLTRKKYANPMVPPRFCAYLRKHITGARIQDIAQDPYERVVRIVLEKKMDAGVTKTLVLAIELLGKGSNVLLLDGDTIMDCLHFRREAEGAARPATPGLVYEPPSGSGRTPPSEMTRDKMEELVRCGGGPVWKALADKISGLSPLLAREIAFGVGTPEALWERFHLLYNRFDAGSFEPKVAALLGGKKILIPFPLASLGSVSEHSYGSMNDAADDYYFETVMKRQMGEQKENLARRIRQLLTRLRRRRENLAADREKFEKETAFRDYGEILTANFPRMKKGMAEIEALDYRDEPPRAVVIPLDESLDPAGNVQRYFKRYKRAKKGLEMTSQRIEETGREEAYLDSVLYQVEGAENPDDLESVRSELEKGRILPAAKRKKTGKEKREPSLPVRKFRSSAGLEIFCGKHNIGNDFLLRRLARDNDLWFHVQGMPGSHVLLKAGREAPGYPSILEAATVAAVYSSGSASTRLPVDYTEARNVRRPKGAKPGMVNYFHQKTISVKPDKDLVGKLAVAED
ncbi:MAG TPA: NFACT RNA binding domain-containing protein [Thermodesulfobacteriota bacterium]|nr:NFACT RNA binding domain-containing protein [Thermodesulfobacteriota bacterium]